MVFRIVRDEEGELSGFLDSPDQGAFDLPLSSVRVIGDSLVLESQAVQGTYRGELEEDRSSLSGTWNQGPVFIALNLVRETSETERKPRPQEPTGPLPYLVEDVEVPNPEAGVTLAGTLTIPPGGGPFPGAVLVSGSGPQDRDESIFGHKPFLVLADHLTRVGIAVLRFDDRGIGSSTGEFGEATSEDFASDATSVVRFLTMRKEVAPDRVGIIGHSEGGLVGPMVADLTDDVSYLVLLAGPSKPGLEILVEQGRLINEVQGTDPALATFNEGLQRSLADVVAAEPDRNRAEPLLRDALADEIEKLDGPTRSAVEQLMTEEAIEATIHQMNSPWFRHFLHYDPLPALKAVRVPVLALLGELDLQVPPSVNLAAFEEAFERSESDDASVLVLPGLNHLFQNAETGSPSEYGAINETMSAVALETISEWIVGRFGMGTSQVR